MNMAIALAKKGEGFTSPNPLVGCVVVKNDKIISTGYHEKYGGFHAERNALLSLSESAKDADLYVTLEPCCHFGKTPPCTDIIIENKIKNVYIGSVDPNPLVSGKGIEILRNHSINVESGILKQECDKLNEVFFHFIRTNTPYVIMKYAMTADGKIATHSGLSKWITGKQARERVHHDRHKYSAIMVGVGTILADNPMLTCRINGGQNPIRIICDTNLSTPIDANIVTTTNEAKTIIATSCTDAKKQLPYIKNGCNIIEIPTKNNHIDLNTLMKELGEIKIDSIILEGGATLNWSALNSGIVNKVQTYISPKIFGGEMAKTPVGGLGISNPNSAFLLKNSVVSQIGNDILIESEV